MFGTFSSRFKPQCPYCKSKRIRRQPRRGFLQRHVYPFFLGYPFHCGSCQTNFVLFVGRNLTKNTKSAGRVRRDGTVY